MAASELSVAAIHFPPDAIYVEWIEGQDFGPDLRRRAPHRHDFHEILWVRSGRSTHVVDDEVLDLGPGSLLIIGRRQIHEYREARQVDGAAVRFGDELAWAAARQEGTRLVLRGGGQRVGVSEAAVSKLEALLLLMEESCLVPRHPWRQTMDRHLLGALLVLLHGWVGGGRTPRLEQTDSAELRLYDRFAKVLEERYATEHNGRFYAAALGVSAGALGRAVANASGLTVRSAILEHVLTEAGRLLQFTDLPVGEVAIRVGFHDAFYFSRVFKRHRAVSPLEFRRRAQGVRG